MLKRTDKSNRRHQSVLTVDYRRRLRWALIAAAARFCKSNPQWAEYFFDLRFLLNRGLPIIERTIAGAAPNGAMDLALACAEEWPSMNAGQRKACLQAQTLIAAELLRLVSEAILLPQPVVHGSVQAQDEGGRRVGMPLAYLQMHNPPTRESVIRQRLGAGRSALIAATRPRAIV